MAFIKPPKHIERVHVLGIRTAEQTKVFATYNSSVYSILVIYDTGEREILECDIKEMNKYINYIIV